ncbi:hypothetical protein SAMN05444398_1011049 [Roseovarius pacificus]|uniref:Uncharacterized protein n=1 Tax=Roseovarius pacificus TaxID=337701 RepID=A0A1M6YVQ3_9RHOB|nr:hypothetical protein [Roseovarius pacificus]GGO50330.1 hypothetical protein GCM10011315_00840 [Roseovarius pacificus]SHL22129.1 hypothetical protein SAMN05444398_1011049 [Roseovarius pacificus]
MYITQHLYARETGRVVETACARLKTVPHINGGRGVHHYHVAAALPTLRPREYDSIPALVLCATPPEDSLYVGGPEALPMARALIEWLPEEPRERFRAVQNSFVVALANSNVCAAPVVENIETLRVLIVLQPDILRWIFRCGDVPDMDRLAPAFAIVNNSSEALAA